METKEQADYLIEHGCLEMQGFFYSKPVSAEEAILLYEKAVRAG